jgi:hypothetical protein
LHGAQHLGLFITHGVRLKANRWLHRREGNQLEDMVGHHVAQGARGVVILAPLLHPHGFGHRDFHVINVAAIPDGFKNPVGEAQNQDVLHGLLAQVVVDAVNLSFIQNLSDLLIEGARRGKVMSKGLLDDDPTLMSVLFPG